jgi:hypothetical protein
MSPLCDSREAKFISPGVYLVDVPPDVLPFSYTCPKCGRFVIADVLLKHQHWGQMKSLLVKSVPWAIREGIPVRLICVQDVMRINSLYDQQNPKDQTGAANPL